MNFGKGTYMIQLVFGGSSYVVTKNGKLNNAKRKGKRFKTREEAEQELNLYKGITLESMMSVTSTKEKK